MRQQQVAAQQRFKRQEATPALGPSSYNPDTRMGPAPYAPMSAMQYPAGPRSSGAPPLPAAMAAPRFAAGSAMATPRGGVNGVTTMRRGPPTAGQRQHNQPPLQQQQRQEYGAGGQPGYSFQGMQEYATGPTARTNAYGMGEPVTCNSRSQHLLSGG